MAARSRTRSASGASSVAGAPTSPPPGPVAVTSGGAVVGGGGGGDRNSRFFTPDAPEPPAPTATPYGVAKRLTKEKHKHLAYVAGYLKKRAALESAYAKMVHKLVVSSQEDIADWTDDEAFLDMWTAFLEIESEFADGHVNFGKRMQGQLAPQLTAHCEASKKNYAKIKQTGVEAKATATSSLSPLMYKLWQSADDKLTDALDQFFSTQMDLLQGQAEQCRTMSATLKEGAAAAAAEGGAAGADEIGIDELLDALPAYEVFSNKARFHKVQYVPGGLAARSKAVVEINFDAHTINIGTQLWPVADLAKWERVPRFHAGRAKEANRERKKSSQILLYWSAHQYDVIIFRTFMDEEVFCQILRWLLRQQYASVALQPRVQASSPASPPAIVLSNTSGQQTISTPEGCFTLFVGTFNMGGTQLPKTGLDAWILPGLDVYAIGVQEIGGAGSVPTVQEEIDMEDEEEDVSPLVWQQLWNAAEEIVFTNSAVQEGDWGVAYTMALKALMQQWSRVNYENVPFRSSASLVQEFRAVMIDLGLPEHLVSDAVTDACLAAFNKLVSELVQSDPNGRLKNERVKMRRTLTRKRARNVKETVLNGWCEPIADFLGEPYEIAATCVLWSIRIVVLVRKAIAPYVTQLEVSKVATGMAGVAGNKGGVAVALRLLDTSVCFVNSHLAAHQEKIKERNQDYSRICKNMDLGHLHLDILNQFDHVFWMGDLNYRIELTREEVFAHVQTKDYNALLRYDQLVREMESQRVFVGFKEARVPNFPPTYKYERGLDGKRFYTDKKARVPSYCDRVLVRSAYNLTRLQPECVYYSDSPSINASDHAPVAATFFVPVRRPYIPKNVTDISRETSRCLIRLTDVAFTPLTHWWPSVSVSFTGVFLRFYADYLPVVYSSAAAPNKKDGPMRWADDDVPTLRPHFADLEYLQAQCLAVSLYVRYGTDNTSADVLGECLVPLASANAAGAVFAVEVTSSGRLVGLMKGTVALQELQVPPASPVTRPRKSLSGDSLSSLDDDDDGTISPPLSPRDAQRAGKNTPALAAVVAAASAVAISAPLTPPATSSSPPPLPELAPPAMAHLPSASSASSSNKSGGSAPAAAAAAAVPATPVKEKQRKKFRLFFGRYRGESAQFVTPEAS